jgi:diguanylate cyclase (GGDEF)-like protein/PAS domain S-box-containing protein
VLIARRWSEPPGLEQTGCKAVARARQYIQPQRNISLRTIQFCAAAFKQSEQQDRLRSTKSQFFQAKAMFRSPTHLTDERALRREILRLRTAVANMSQGLLMFDDAARLVLCNQRYLDIYGLTAQDVALGCTLRELVDLRVKMGSFSGVDPAQYVAELRAAIAAGKNVKDLVELTDGRTIAVVSRPMPEGGWVATHEDITERRLAEKALAAAQAQAERAEQDARAAHARLLDALEVVPEGIVVFDSDDKLVLWNRRYAEIQGEHGIELRPGLPFEAMLRDGLARGRFPDAQDREDQWLAERLALHARQQSSHEQRLPGDRWLRIEERRTSGGGSVGVRIDITELKRREASFRLLFEGNPLPMWVYDHDSLRFLAVNEAAVEHYGYTLEQFVAMTLLDIRPAEDRDELRKLAGTRQADHRFGRTWRHRKADGSQIEVAIFSRLLTYEGRQASMVAVVDITERKRAEDDLRHTREFLHTIVENLPATLVVRDAQDGRYVLVNRAGEELYGVPREDMLGKNAYELFPKEEADAIAARDAEVLASSQPVIIDALLVHTPSKGERLVKSKRLRIAGDDGVTQYVLSFVEDVTERKKAEDKIAYLAHHDALTGLANRAAFTEHLGSTLQDAEQRGECFAVLCIDLDRFKEVNDVFGHSAGDELLREVSCRLTEAAPGAFLARLGGDEFTLISAQGQQPSTAERLAEHLLATVDDVLVIDGHQLRAGMSIGVAIYPTDGTDSATLLANADAALYRAKAEGRGMIRFFEADMDKRLRERRALQHDLQSAVPRGELVLHYQPQAAMDGEIVGFEALVRWRHPTRGIVTPDSFISLAEESGSIIAIGEWTLREACREAASWPRNLQVAVNLSPVQFRHGDLPALVHQILLETGMNPARLQLEITEGVLIGDFSRAVSILRRLKAFGVRIAMDDFGTGYSSLSYLQSFPFDSLKIDRSFISSVDRNDQSAAIVRAVIGLARGLSVPVVAEGVETSEQFAFLAREACDEVQGYLVGRPGPIGEYAAIVSRRHGDPSKAPVGRAQALG